MSTSWPPATTRVAIARLFPAPMIVTFISPPPNRHARLCAGDRSSDFRTRQRSAGAAFVTTTAAEYDPRDGTSGQRPRTGRGGDRRLRGGRSRGRRGGASGAHDRDERGPLVRAAVARAVGRPLFPGKAERTNGTRARRSRARGGASRAGGGGRRRGDPRGKRG